MGPRRQMDVGVAVVEARGWGQGSGGVPPGVGQSGHSGGPRRAHLLGQVKRPGPHPSPGLRGCVPSPPPVPAST